MVREYAESITCASEILQTIESLCRPVITPVKVPNYDLPLKDPVVARIVKFIPQAIMPSQAWQHQPSINQRSCSLFYLPFKYSNFISSLGIPKCAK